VRDSPATALSGGDRTVRWVGAQRDVLAGDVSGKIALDELAHVPHLYALGPREDLRGEVTVFDGVPSVARVVDGGVEIDAGFGHRACFLVFADVPSWDEVRHPAPLLSMRAIEAAVVEAAGDRGLDSGAPFPFKITGRAERLVLHLLDKRDGLPHTPELHERAKVRFTASGEAVEVIGFFSTGHRGIFTPKDANVHMHVRTADGRLSGHLEELALSAGASLWLPRPRGGKGEAT
jgi:acetolactate decarboxylase